MLGKQAKSHITRNPATYARLCSSNPATQARRRHRTAIGQSGAQGMRNRWPAMADGDDRQRRHQRRHRYTQRHRQKRFGPTNSHAPDPETRTGRTVASANFRHSYCRIKPGRANATQQHRQLVRRDVSRPQHRRLLIAFRPSHLHYRRRQKRASNRRQLARRSIARRSPVNRNNPAIHRRRHPKPASTHQPVVIATATPRQHHANRRPRQLIAQPRVKVMTENDQSRMTANHTKKIRELNDALRKTLTGGKVMFTQG